MSAIYGTKNYKKDFEIDIKELGECKGIYSLEVFISDKSMPLVVKDGSNQIIKDKNNPFKIKSPVPIVKGIIRFEFQNFKGVENTVKQATVRFLFHGELD